MRQIEVHVDHMTGRVAIQWPDLQGVYVLHGPPLGPDYELPAYQVPGGMTQLVDPTASEADAAAIAQVDAGVLAAVPRQRAPRRYHPIGSDEYRSAPGGGATG